MEKKININELVNELVNELKEKVSDDAKRGTISINCQESKNIFESRHSKEVKISFSEKGNWKVEESKEVFAESDPIKRRVTIHKSQLHCEDEIIEKYYDENNRLIKKICGDYCEKYEYKNGKLSKSIFIKNGKSTLTYYNESCLPVKQLFCGNSSVVRAKDYNTVFSAEYNQKGYMTNLVKDNGSITKEYSFMGDKIVSHKSIFKNKNNEVIGMEVASLNDHGHLTKLVSNGKTIREFKYDYDLSYNNSFNNFLPYYAFLDLGDKTIIYKRETKRFGLNEYKAPDSDKFCYQESRHQYIIKQCGLPLPHIINIMTVEKYDALNKGFNILVSKTYDSGLLQLDSYKMYKINDEGELENLSELAYDSNGVTTKSHLLDGKIIKKETWYTHTASTFDDDSIPYQYSIYEEFGTQKDIERYDSYFDDQVTEKEINNLIMKEMYQYNKIIKHECSILYNLDE